MSLKAIKEALDYLENNPTADEAQDARRRARAEFAALEEAARNIRITRAKDGESNAAAWAHFDRIFREAK